MILSNDNDFHYDMIMVYDNDNYIYDKYYNKDI